MALILILGWRRVGRDYPGMSDVDPEAIGAAVGAGIATAYGWKHSVKLTSILRFISGSWSGTFGTALALHWVGWEPTTPNRMFMASIVGLGAFIVVQAILSSHTRVAAQKALQAVITRRAEK